MRRTEGYTYKSYPGLRLLVRGDLVPVYSEREWQDFCFRLFQKPTPEHLRKQTSAKEISTLRFPPQERGATCLVKKYTSRGLAKIAKDLWRGSRALHEFQIALAIHARGIPTAVPLLVAERVKQGVVYESLLVLPFLRDACELKDFFLDPQNSCGSACSAAERRSIIQTFGRLTAMIFQAGINQNDYSLNNFLIRKEDSDHKIYFIDFERAVIAERITDQEKTELLAKLNRAGREVTVKDRLRFLRAYLETEASSGEKPAPCARELQKQTLAMIQRDLKRGRLTSIYTSGAYEKFSTADFRGMHKSGYRLEEILNKLAVLPGNVHQAAVTMKCGTDEHYMTVVRMEPGTAERTWAVINALKLAGLPLHMQHIYAEGRDCGFLFFNVPETKKIPAPEDIRRQAGPGTMKVIETCFPDELANIFSLYRTLRQQQ